MDIEHAAIVALIIMLAAVVPSSPLARPLVAAVYFPIRYAVRLLSRKPKSPETESQSAH
jgi:hypothetical protein